MAYKDRYSLRHLKQDFPNDAACLEAIYDAMHNRKCSCGGTYSPMFKMGFDENGKYKLLGRKQFQCSKCRYQIAPMAGTLFEKSDTPLMLWFHAFLVFSNAKSGISAKELERQIGVTYKTAWRMLNLIRKNLKQGNRPLAGTVEMDEAYFGGHGYGGKYNKNASHVIADKSKVIAAIERKGIVRAKEVKDLTSQTIGEFLKENVDTKAKIMTDGSNRYNIAARKFDRESVNHSVGRYVSGNVHVNNVEGFWSHVKRSIKGTHKSVSKQHFQSYLDGFVFLRNNRHNDNQRFLALLTILLHSVKA